MAFSKQFKGGQYMLLTDEDGLATPLSLSEKAMLGLYNKDGEDRMRHAR